MLIVLPESERLDTLLSFDDASLAIHVVNEPPDAEYPFRVVAEPQGASAIKRQNDQLVEPLAVFLVQPTIAEAVILQADVIWRIGEDAVGSS